MGMDPKQCEGIHVNLNRKFRYSGVWEDTKVTHSRSHSGHGQQVHEERRGREAS